MSKKLAESPAALVLELTYGCAAPMKTEADARNLAQKMVIFCIVHGIIICIIAYKV